MTARDILPPKLLHIINTTKTDFTFDNLDGLLYKGVLVILIGDDVVDYYDLHTDEESTEGIVFKQIQDILQPITWNLNLKELL